MDELPTSAACNLAEIASLGREELVKRLLSFQGDFRLDFTETFLALKSTDELRHILIAACKHAAKGGLPRHRVGEG